MARIRTVKPDIWTDESFTECSMSARLLFIGMFNFADDNGNLVRSSKKIKMQVFPADSVDCEPLIQELMTHGLLTEYSVNEEKFLKIKGFRKHQVINRPSASLIPDAEIHEDSRSTHGVVSDDSKREGKGREGNGIKNNNLSVIAKKTERGCRLPADFWPKPEPDSDAAMTAAGIDPVAELPRFRDHWAQAAGPSAVKRDWQAAWRNWCRNAMAYAADRQAKSPARQARQPPPESAYQRGLREAGAVLAPSVGRVYDMPAKTIENTAENAIILTPKPRQIEA